MKRQEKSLKISLEESKANINVSEQGKDNRKKRKPRKKRKRHKVTLSQRISWQEFKNSGKRGSEFEFILALLKLHNTKRSRRQLEEESNIRPTNMTRIMKDLENSKEGFVSDELVVCEYSGRLVQVYGVIGKEYSEDD